MTTHTNLPVELKPKLVRDKIPEIIEAAEPVRAVVKILNQKEYLNALVAKIHEEAAELELALNENTNVAEELADLLELIHAVAHNKKLTLKSLEQIRQSTQLMRGGFAKRLMLIGKTSKQS